jgi:hypothetical protein
MESQKKHAVCAELQNIKYKTMLLKGSVPVETKVSGNLDNLEKFLETEKNNNTALNDQPWNKLDKTIKLKKFQTFVEKYAEENNLSDEDTIKLFAFLKDCIDRKKLKLVKDVEYNKITGEIISIPALVYSKTSKHFTLKNSDKRVSTLKSLPPKKTTTIKHKTESDEDEDD